MDPSNSSVLWVGTGENNSQRSVSFGDGVYRSRDGGANWDLITPEQLPEWSMINMIELSPHDAATAYIAVLRYQLGDSKPYIYKTDNFGRSWNLLTDGRNGIPANEPTRVVREDPVNAGLLYAGTDSGMFVSIDDGETWHPFQQNLAIRDFNAALQEQHQRIGFIALVR